jgi:hypothetical protein
VLRSLEWWYNIVVMYVKSLSVRVEIENIYVFSGSWKYGVMLSFEI